MHLRKSCHFFLALLASASAGTTLISSAGGLQLQSVPDISTSEGLVAVLSSPGTPSVLSAVDELAEDDVLTLVGGRLLVCRGAALRGTSPPEREALATCSVVANVVVVDGITMGDVEAGLGNSRHARTLTAIFRARLAVAPNAQQTTVLVVAGDISELDEEDLKMQVKALYDAVSLEVKDALPFEDCYKVQLVSAASAEDSSKVLSIATEEAAKSGQGQENATSLAAALSSASGKVISSGVGAVALDTPCVADAFVAVGNAYEQQLRKVRSKIVAWQSRAARGLLVDGFGVEATLLRDRVLATFDAQTRSVAGLSLVAAYRKEMRSQLQTLLDTGVEETFAALVENLKASALKRLQATMLRTVNDSAESIVESNTAALRKESFTVETVLEDLEVPVLGLTKEKAAREISNELSNAAIAFPDSPAAKIKRSSRVKTVVNKEKKPSQRSVDLGLDLVAVLRPDGFGSLQGYAAYQLGGNSITFGVHNDADDPQTIAQFGGVRPPLLRVQPKLRVDVEL